MRENTDFTEVPVTEASEKADLKIIAAPVAEAEDDLILRFAKPYIFEGKEYTEVDLSGLDRLTARDMTAGEQYLTKSGGYSPTPEMSVAYACFMASRATGKPIEFFNALPLKEAVKLKNRIGSFFYDEG